jgi:hypothetical protein
VPVPHDLEDAVDEAQAELEMSPAVRLHDQLARETGEEGVFHVVEAIDVTGMVRIEDVDGFGRWVRADHGQRGPDVPD